MPLYLIATPIGNLEDITLRALKHLREADLIYSEDTRVSIKLLNHFEITGKKLISCNKENEFRRIAEIKSSLAEDKNIVLISDAGTPLISDPGSLILQELWGLSEESFIHENRTPHVIPIGGISSLSSALSVCPLDTSRFVFEGFLPHGGKQRRRVLKRLLNEERPIVFFESPHRVIDTLEDLEKLFNVESEIAVDQEKTPTENTSLVFIAREMTKLHEDFFLGTPMQAVKWLQNKFPNGKIQGEFVLIFKHAFCNESR
ncbi:MAG: 16S rRNA (cytidine(1402)-2'-O)-methyltransferase [bacterium]